MSLRITEFAHKGPANPVLVEAFAESIAFGGLDGSPMPSRRPGVGGRLVPAVKVPVAGELWDLDCDTIDQALPMISHLSAGRRDRVVTMANMITIEAVAITSRIRVLIEEPAR
jgi:hypothetical protein